MPGETHRIPLSTWRRELVRATVLAYRAAAGAGKLDPDAYAAARDAYIGAEGDPAQAPREVMQIVSAAARDHGEWFWRPVRERLEREERYWRRRGMWPPPKNPQDWPADLR